MSFQEAETIFGDPEEFMFGDPDHSEDEERWISIGVSDEGRMLLVCYTEELPVIRIISAREVEPSEVAMYLRV